MQEVDHIVDALGLVPGARVLDVGCGPGRHAHELARRGIAVHGIDIAQTFVDLARRDAPDGATFERLDARALPFDGEFDAVVCLCQGAFGLMTADGDDDLVVAGMARALRPGGRLALSAFNAYFAVRYHEDGHVRRRHGRLPRAHRDPRPRRPCGGGRSVDRLLHAPRAAPAARRPRAHGRSHQQRRARRVRRRGADDGVARVLVLAHRDLTAAETLAARHAIRVVAARAPGAGHPMRQALGCSDCRERRSVPAEAERVADGIGVHPERVLRVEVPGAEADGALVGGVEIGDLEVDVQLLLHIGPRPRRGDEVGGPLEREVRASARRARRLIHSSSPSSGASGQSRRRE